VECVTRIGSTANGIPEHLVLICALAQELERVARAEDRDVEALEEVGDGPDVVFVAVREEDAVDVPREALERAEVGVNDVDAEPPVVEGDAAVDQEDLPVLLDREAVHPHLAEAAQGHQPDRLARGGAFGGGSPGRHGERA